MLTTIFLGNFLYDTLHSEHTSDENVKNQGFGKIHNLKKTISFEITKQPTKVIKTPYSLDCEGRYPAKTDSNRGLEYFPVSSKSLLREIYFDKRPTDIQIDFAALMNFPLKQQGAILTDLSNLADTVNIKIAHQIIGDEYASDKFHSKNNPDIIAEDKSFNTQISTFGRTKELVLGLSTLEEKFPHDIESIRKTIRYSDVSRYDLFVTIEGKDYKIDVFSPVKLYTNDFFMGLKSKLYKFHNEEDVMIIINNGSNFDYDVDLNKNVIERAERINPTYKYRLVIATPKYLNNLANIADINFDYNKLIFKQKGFFSFWTDPKVKSLTCDSPHFMNVINKNNTR